MCFSHIFLYIIYTIYVLYKSISLDMLRAWRVEKRSLISWRDVFDLTRPGLKIFRTIRHPASGCREPCDPIGRNESRERSIPSILLSYRLCDRRRRSVFRFRDTRDRNHDCACAYGFYGPRIVWSHWPVHNITSLDDIKIPRDFVIVQTNETQ